MGQRREKQYRQLERRVSVLETRVTSSWWKYTPQSSEAGPLDGAPANSTAGTTAAFKALSEVIDAPYRRHSEQTRSKSLFQRFLAFFRGK